MAGTPAGRLSVEIVADIARLQKDLDKAKREVSRASRDIGKSARAANDNIAGMGRSMGGVNTMSRAMRANMINLGRQVQDVGTMFALGARPMQIFASQGAQIADVLVMMRAEAKATNTSLTAMTLRGAKRFAPVAIGIGAATVALGGLRAEINKTSDVTVTYGDVALGTFDAISDFVGRKLSAAFEALGIDVAEVWQMISTGARNSANFVIGAFVAAKNTLLAAWGTFPAGFAELFIDAVNGAIMAIEKLINASISGINRFTAVVDDVIGFDLGQISQINLPKLEQNYRGAGAAAGAALREGVSSSFGRDYLAEMAEAISPFAQERARRRLEAEAEAAGKGAGRALKKGAEEEIADFDEVFADIIRTSQALEAPMRENRAIAERIARLEREAQAIGLVGWERERLILTLEHQAEVQERLMLIAAAEQSGQANLAATLRRQVDLLREEYTKAIEAGDVLRAYDAHEDRIYELSNLYEDLFTDGIGGLWDNFERMGLQAISAVAAEWTLSLLSGQSMGNAGSIAGGALSQGPLGALFNGGSIFAANDNSPASQGINGAATKPGGFGFFGGDPLGGQQVPGLGGIGNIGLALGATALISELSGGGTGSQIGGLAGGVLGSVIPGVGTVLGSVIGSALGGIADSIIGGSDRGSAIISGGRVSGFYGDTQEFKDQAGGLAGNVLDSLETIADALDADLNSSVGRVSIGIRDGDFRVDPQGRGYTKTSKFPDILDFGSDSEAAVRAAILDLINDGVISGISQASMNILRAGKDLEEAIEKAALIESIPDLLQQRLDPLGFALKEIDEQFGTLADALREGGATAQQFADAEKLYNLERQEAIDRFESGSGSLRSFLDSLAVGSNSPLSAASQYATAASRFAGFEQDILAGNLVDQDAFTEAAQTLLDLSRQNNASGAGFFSDFDRVRSLGEQALATAEANRTDPAEAADLFSRETAENTRASAVMQEEANALLRDIRQAINDNGGTVNPDWFQDPRRFTA